MTPDVIETIVNLGGTAVLVWMTYNLWTEVRAQNERIYILLQQQLQRHEELQQQVRANAAALPPKD